MIEGKRDRGMVRRNEVRKDGKKGERKVKERSEVWNDGRKQVGWKINS